MSLLEDQVEAEDLAIFIDIEGPSRTPPELSSWLSLEGMLVVEFGRSINLVLIYAVEFGKKIEYLLIENVFK